MGEEGVILLMVKKSRDGGGGGGGGASNSSSSSKRRRRRRRRSRSRGYSQMFVSPQDQEAKRSHHKKGNEWKTLDHHHHPSHSLLV